MILPIFNYIYIKLNFRIEVLIRMDSEEIQQNYMQYSYGRPESNLPDQQLDINIFLNQLEESSVSLERVAAFCEANYVQSKDKATALAETKRYALQSLASVAYFTGELSRSLLHAIELESVNISRKTAEIQNLSQLIAIQKEETARREIGKLTANKNIVQQNKVTYPTTEERIPRYQRVPIDFTILDGIGNGRRTVPTNDYGSVGAYHGGYGTYGIAGQLIFNNRAASTASGESGGISGAPPIYDHYARSNYNTLSRGSVRSVATLHDQYRVPQPIASTIHQQLPIRTAVQYPYHTLNQRCASNSHQLPTSVHGTEMGTINTSNGHCQQQYNNEEQRQYGIRIAPNHLSQNTQMNDGQLDGSNVNIGEVMNNSAEFSDDGLPLPPPLLLANMVGTSQQKQRFHDSLQSSNSGRREESGEVPNWIPQQFIEKAVVLYDYDSRNPDELHLYQGALVYVLRKNEDGWFEGVMDGLTGLFPGNYVRKLSS